jgi:transitional endoplasmic reticulum ATPase
MNVDSFFDQCLTPEPCGPEDQTFDDRRTTADRKKKNLKEKKSPNLVIEPLSKVPLNSLVEPSVSYAQTLRIFMLRLLVRTPAANSLRLRPGYAMNSVCNLLGFTNFERYSEDRTLMEILKDLNRILKKWESEQRGVPYFPKELTKNVRALSDVVGLNDNEKKLLSFAVLIYAEPVLEQCADLLGSDQSGFSVHRILAPVLGIQEKTMQEILDRKATLASSGLLAVDYRGRYDLKQLLDLITPTFPSRMVSPQTDIRTLVEGFVRPATLAELSLSNFSYLSHWPEMIQSYLTNAAVTARKGANILIYGQPGTGKSQFARAVANSLGLNLMEISQTNLGGNAVTPIRRIRSYQIAQKFFGERNTAILFDETEEIFVGGVLEQSDDEASVPQKSFFNTLLENNKLPTIWIANTINRFDQAYLRRFDICFEMPTPPKSVRLAMIQGAFDNTISESLKQKLADNEHITPAMLNQVARVSGSINSAIVLHNLDRLVYELANHKLKAQRASEIPDTESLGLVADGFDPVAINCEIDLLALKSGLEKTRTARICVFGPPGTGKTAFGKWIAESLEMPHLVLRSSDLRSAYVGETEKNIARAFAHAKREKAVLQLDEVDSFLRDRSKAERNFEVIQVNEMLTQMESFQGIFIASTNLFENLDEASLRRFDLAFKFDYLKPQAAVKMFEKTCAKLELDSPNASLLQRVAALRNLTPGDLQQILRRTSLVRPRSSQELYVALEGALKLKKNAQTKPIGFLRVA